MKSDLLFAHAAVEWAEFNIPSFRDRTQLWLRNNMRLVMRVQENSPTHDLLVAIEKEPFPLAFSAEYGAYLNSVRSSLDILAVALGERFGVARLDKVYFPVAKSAAAFASSDFQRKELIRALPSRERAILDLFKPYHGGNDDLWRLHELDIRRKHHRLLTVESSVRSFALSYWERPNIDATANNPVAIPSGIGANGEAALMLIPKGANNPNRHATYEIKINEPELGIRAEAGAALSKFCKLARSFIDAFE